MRALIVCLSLPLSARMEARRIALIEQGFEVSVQESKDIGVTGNAATPILLDELIPTELARLTLGIPLVEPVRIPVRPDPIAGGRRRKGGRSTWRLK